MILIWYGQSIHYFKGKEKALLSKLKNFLTSEAYNQSLKTYKTSKKSWKKLPQTLSSFISGKSHIDYMWKKREVQTERTNINKRLIMISHTWIATPMLRNGKLIKWFILDTKQTWPVSMMKLFIKFNEISLKQFFHIWCNLWTRVSFSYKNKPIMLNHIEDKKSYSITVTRRLKCILFLADHTLVHIWFQSVYWKRRPLFSTIKWFMIAKTSSVVYIWSDFDASVERRVIDLALFGRSFPYI